MNEKTERQKPVGPPYVTVNNVALTKALFHENNSIAPHPKYLPVFCLYGEQPGLISCQETFLELRDPTGRKWALKYLKSWNHFLKLMKTSYFSEAFKAWKEELSSILLAEALEKIQELMGSEKENISFAAAKYLAEEGWTKEERKTSKRGRPSKEEIKGALKEETRLTKEEAADMARIGLVVDNT